MRVYKLEETACNVCCDIFAEWRVKQNDVALSIPAWLLCYVWRVFQLVAEVSGFGSGLGLGLGLSRIYYISKFRGVEEFTDKVNSDEELMLYFVCMPEHNTVYVLIFKNAILS